MLLYSPIVRIGSLGSPANLRGGIVGDKSLTCPSCGNAIEIHDAFCGECGKALPAGTAPPPVVIHEIGHGEPPPTPATDLAPWRGGEVALGVLVIVFAMIPVVLLSGQVGDLAGRYDTAARVWASSHLMGLVILGVVWQFGLKGFRVRLGGDLRTGLREDLRGNLQSLGLNLPRTRLLWSVLLTLGTLVGSLAATGIYSALVRWLNLGPLVPPDIPSDLAFPGIASILTFQALAVWTPITEEIFFRGFIFAGLVSRLGPWGAMAASALVFSLFHVDPGVLVPIFITGFMLAWLYRRTGSLWPGIVAHAGQNALALLAAIFLV